MKFGHKFFFILLVASLPASCTKEDQYLYDRTGFTPKTYQGVYPAKYVPYKSPGSRNYKNPYKRPPSNQYPYYDHDYYYVPPIYYNNVEPDYGSADPKY